MITLNQWMELIDYRITEGYEYLWKCYGEGAYSLSSWNEDVWQSTITFDTFTKEVFCVDVNDYRRNRAYRIINSEYKDDHDKEASDRGVSKKEAWEGVDFIDLEDDNDFMDKCASIRDDVEYDTRISCPLTVPDDVLFELMKKAHEKDVTLNKLIEEVLWEAIHEEEAKRDAA